MLFCFNSGVNMPRCEKCMDHPFLCFYKWRQPLPSGRHFSRSKMQLVTLSLAMTTFHPLARVWKNEGEWVNGNYTVGIICKEKHRSITKRKYSNTFILPFGRGYYVRSLAIYVVRTGVRIPSSNWRAHDLSIFAFAALSPTTTIDHSAMTCRLLITYRSSRKGQ